MLFRRSPIEDPVPSSEDGQSLVEFAIALPVLLLILVGLFDLGRAFFITTALAKGAAEAARYAAMEPTATLATVEQRACDGTGLAGYGQPCTSMHVESATYGSQRDAVIVLRYDFVPIYGRLITGLGSPGGLPVRAMATFPGMGQ